MYDKYPLLPFPLLPLLAIVNRIVVCCLLTWVFGRVYIFGRGIFLIWVGGFLFHFVFSSLHCYLYWDLMKIQFHKLTDRFFLSHIFLHLAVPSVVVVLWLFCFIL